MRKKLLLALLVFLLLAIPAGWLQLKDGVMLDGRFFAQKNQWLYVHGKNQVAITPAENGAQLRIDLDGETLDAALSISGDLYTFAYADGRSVEGTAGKREGELTDAGGAPLWLQDGVVITVGNESEPSILSREYTLSNSLYHMVEGICEQRGHVLVLLCAMLLYGLGTASFFWPEEVHFFGSRWAYAHAELSVAGIAVQKITGIVWILVGVALLYAPLLW